MNDHQLDQLLRRAMSPTDAVVGSLDLGRGEQELLEEIMSTPVTSPLNPAVPQPPPGDAEVLELSPVTVPPALASPAPPARRRRRALIGLAAAAAFITAIAGPTLVFRGGDEFTVSPGRYSAQALAVANGNPRLLVDDPAWKITHVDEFTTTSGEIRFSNGARNLDVHWYPTGLYQDHREDRRDVSKPEPFQVLGHDGELFTYDATQFTVILPPQGKSFLELRGGVGDQRAFAAVVARLKPVSVEQWLAAMPASVVTPAETTAVAAQMLADVPLPPGFDRSSLPTTGTNDYYQFGAAVIGQVTCAWLKDYVAARETGDLAGMARVADALGTSRAWKTLEKMNAEGDYPEAVWEFADQVSKRQTVDAYQEALGCE